MTAPIKINRAVALADAVRCFELRCWARATLVGACEFDTQEAVDVLQRDAERDGLVAAIGQDCVQSFISHAFSTIPIAGQVEADLRAVAEYLVRQNDLPRLKNWLLKHSAAERAAIRKYFSQQRW